MAVWHGVSKGDGRELKTIGITLERPRGALNLDRQGTLWVATESTIVFLPARARRFQTTGVQIGQVPQFADSSVGKVWMAETTRSVRPVPDHRPSSTDPEIRVGSNAILFDHE